MHLCENENESFLNAQVVTKYLGENINILVKLEKYMLFVGNKYLYKKKWIDLNENGKI